MPTDARIDAYIEAAAPFAQPILRHFRSVLHAKVPTATEKIKWGMPFFEHKGGPIAMMAAFKAHTGIGIFDGTLRGNGDGMGQLGKLKCLADLPDTTMLNDKIANAVALVESGVKPMRLNRTKPPLEVPTDLRSALDAVPAAAASFASFPPSAQREYVEWALEAKQATTRTRRITTTVEQCAEGKRRYWAMAGR